MDTPFFDKIVIINLPSRTDRRKEAEEQITKAGLLSKGHSVEFFPAFAFEDKGDWPSPGSRGCFLSHYQVIKDAKARGDRHLLILEDDCEFTPAWNAFYPELIPQLQKQRWDMIFLGHQKPFQGAHTLSLAPLNEGSVTTHCYAIQGAFFEQLLSFMEAVMQRRPGDPLGGPQHLDGAYHMFREQNKQAALMIANPSLATQRSSRSDVTPSWQDRIPWIAPILDIARKAKHLMHR